MGQSALRPSLRTARLTLRPPSLADAPRVATLANDYDVARMTTRIAHPYGTEDAEAFIRLIEGRDPSREVVFAIGTDADGVMGMVGLHPTPAGTEIGYWLGRPFWGLGYATEAAEAAVEYAAAQLGRRYIVSGHFADNLASGAVLCKVGFLYTGAIEPRWSLARGEDAPTRMMVWLA